MDPKLPHNIRNNPMFHNFNWARIVTSRMETLNCDILSRVWKNDTEMVDYSMNHKFERASLTMVTKQ